MVFLGGGRVGGGWYLAGQFWISFGRLEIVLFLGEVFLVGVVSYLYRRVLYYLYAFYILKNIENFICDNLGFIKVFLR